MLAHKLLSACGGESKLYVDDCFACYTYTGNGYAQTINNGIDLAGKGGMVWQKSRNAAIGAGHILTDTVQGIVGNTSLSTTSTGINSTLFGNNGVTTFNSNGFNVGNNTINNSSGDSLISWTFRKAPKFFDVVTYTGNGANNLLNHSLGVTPGFVVVKRTDSISDWWATCRRSDGFYSSQGKLNTAGAFSNNGNLTAAQWGLTDTTFNANLLGSFSEDTNASGATYVAYLFAHDPSADGIVQCGSFTSADPAGPNLGWEPQWLLMKDASNSDNWYIFDSSRGWSHGPSLRLLANTAAAEADLGPGDSYGSFPTATGFSTKAMFAAGHTIVYVAIRRPNKPPTTGTQVYNAIARTGTGAAATVSGVGFAPDMSLHRMRLANANSALVDRLRGTGMSADQTKWLVTSASNAEATMNPGGVVYTPDGASIGSYLNVAYSGQPFIDYFFKRAPGVVDIVCYTGTGSATTIAHNLGAAPELMVVKVRNTANQWNVYAAPIGNSQSLVLNSANPVLTSVSLWGNVNPTNAIFTLGGGFAGVNSLGDTYVAYLFATKAGISKVGGYTGNGSSQTINAGFTTGARLILIKRTDATGDWYIWDSVRGIVAGNDPHLSLNSTAAEVTTNDSIDPDNTGFIVNQLAATNINVTSATYIYLALA